MPSTAQLLRLARDAAPSTDPLPPDTELLQRYVAARDEASFAELVRRNGPLVLRACRNILGEAGADDAFQATFLLLARSARRFTRPGSLAVWLHAAAIRIATNARRGEERRRKRERSRPIRSISPDDLTWSEVREVLDREIVALPERHRLPVLLCYVLELSNEEAARRAGCSVGALRGRLERGKDQLRKRLTRYGLPLAAPALVLGAPPPVTAALVESTMAAVRSGVSGATPPALAGLLRPPGSLRGILFLTPATGAVVVIGAVLAASTEPADQPPRSAPAPTSRTAAMDAPTQVDALGDPLPPGALARLGSARFQHGENLSRVIVAADGKFVVSVSRHDGYKLWEGDTGRPVPLCKRLRNLPREGRFRLTSAGGKIAAIIWEGEKCQLLDPMTGELIRELPSAYGTRGSALAPDGKTVATLRRVAGEARFTVSVWNADNASWTDLDTVTDPTQHRPLQFSADARVLASQASDGAIHVWEIATGKTVLQLPGNEQRYAEVIDLSPDGKLLARADLAAKRIRLFDLTNAKELPTLPDQTDKLVRALAFSPDGEKLAATGDSVTIRLWDVSARKKLRDIQGHGFQVFGLAFSGDGKKLFAADGNGVSVWDPATGKPLDDYGGHRYTIWSAAWSPDGKRLASGAEYTDKNARVWDPATGRKEFDLVGQKSGIEEVAYSPDGSLLATGSRDGTVRMWNPSTGKELDSFAAKDGSVCAMDFSPDGRFLVTGGTKALHVWDVAERKEMRTVTHGGGWPLQLTFLPDGRRVLVRDYKSGTRVIDLTTGREVARIDEAGNISTAAAVSPDGRYVAQADSGGAIRLADASNGREVRLVVSPIALPPPSPPFKQPPNATKDVMGLAYSPDGRTLAVAYRDGIHIHEVATGSERFRFKGHVDDVTGVCFSPDGNRLCSYSGDRTILIWDVTGCRLPPAALPKDIAAAWADLASPDAARGFAAVRYMVAAPGPAVGFLTARVKPVGATNAKTVAELIGKLSSAEFEEREAASKELAALAPAALDQLREAAVKSELPEVRKRLAAVLVQSAGGRLTGEPLRQTRAVEVLERIGSLEARNRLLELSKGAPGARLTEEASQSLRRIVRR